MSDTEPAVVRTWLRDGSRNLMSLDQAVDNLAQNQADGEAPGDERRDAIRRYLLAGQTLRTRFATFALES